MAKKEKRISFRPNIRPGFSLGILPGLRLYTSLGLKGPKFYLTGDPVKMVKTFLGKK